LKETGEEERGWREGEGEGEEEELEEEEEYKKGGG
jgi:hypothetical protein